MNENLPDNFLWPGQYYIEFAGAEAKWINVDRIILDINGHPIYIISGKTHYNWNRIISMRGV
jgi:hypothetical protein